MSFLFERLKAYEEGIRFSEEVYRLTARFPKGTSGIVDQLRRAALSIPANLAEGSGRWHMNDRKQFFWVARGSANECIPLLKFAATQNIITMSDYWRLRSSLEVIAKMITRLISQQKSHNKNAQPSEI